MLDFFTDVKKTFFYVFLFSKRFLFKKTLAKFTAASRLKEFEIHWVHKKQNTVSSNQNVRDHE